MPYDCYEVYDFQNVKSLYGVFEYIDIIECLFEFTDISLMTEEARLEYADRWASGPLWQKYPTSCSSDQPKTRYCCS